jgi:hypothetical protein
LLFNAKTKELIAQVSVAKSNDELASVVQTAQKEVK